MISHEEEQPNRHSLDDFPSFETKKVTLNALSLSPGGFTIRTRASLLRHPANTPLPGARAIQAEREKEPRAFRVGPGFKPKVGLRDSQIRDDELSFDLLAVTYPTYSAFGSHNVAEVAYAIANPAATACALFTTESDGSRLMLIQRRSARNRWYPAMLGASAAGFLDGRLSSDQRSRGRLEPIDTPFILRGAVKEIEEETGAFAPEIADLVIAGWAQDLVRIHSEFLLVGTLAVSYDTLRERAKNLHAAPTTDSDSRDFAEQVFAIEGSIASIQRLLTETRAPLPSTHLAALAVAGSRLMAHQAGVDAARAWLRDMGALVATNDASIDERVHAYHLALRHERALPSSSAPQLRDSYDPALPPTSQGLPDGLEELERLRLLART